MTEVVAHHLVAMSLLSAMWHLVLVRIWKGEGWVVSTHPGRRQRMTTDFAVRCLPRR